VRGWEVLDLTTVLYQSRRRCFNINASPARPVPVRRPHELALHGGVTGVQHTSCSFARPQISRKSRETKRTFGSPVDCIRYLTPNSEGARQCCWVGKFKIQRGPVSSAASVTNMRACPNFARLAGGCVASEVRREALFEHESDTLCPLRRPCSPC